jgi:dTDP-glucose 4,6-dehydratase
VLTETILSAMGKGKEQVEYVKDRPGHDRRYALDSSKIEKMGWAVSGDFASNIDETIRWYRENPGWWEPIKEKAEIIKW